MPGAFEKFGKTHGESVYLQMNIWWWRITLPAQVQQSTNDILCISKGKDILAAVSNQTSPPEKLLACT